MTKFIPATILLTLLLSGCNSATNVKQDSGMQSPVNDEVSQPVNYVLKSFTSSKFSIQLEVPENWSVTGMETMDAITDAGANVIAGEDKMMQAAIEESSSRTENIFALMQYELGSPVASNPSLMSVAEDLTLAPGVKRGSDYLYHVRTMVAQGAVPYTFKDGYATVQLSGYEFDILQGEITARNRTIYQQYYATRIDNMVLSFILTFMNKNEEQMLYEILNTIDIKTISDVDRLSI